MRTCGPKPIPPSSGTRNRERYFEPSTPVLNQWRWKSAKQEPTHGTAEEWVYTRGVILRVLGRFPDALTAIRDALAEVRRACPKELYEPG
jgi:hypothetical protein